MGVRGERRFLDCIDSAKRAEQKFSLPESWGGRCRIAQINAASKQAEKAALAPIMH
jgi:hypothetical protein